MSFAGGVGYTNIDLLYSGLDDLPKKGQEIYAKQFSMQFGGGVPATMINMSRLGIPTKVLSFVGEDLFSQFVKDKYSEYQVDLINLYEGDGMPVILSATMICQQDRSFLSYFDPIEIAPETLRKVYESLTGAKVVDMHIGFLDVYRKLKQEGTIQVFDTGWEDDLSLEKYEEYLKLADYYIPNQKEALKITGEKTLEAAAEKLAEYFSDVIIKLDKEGCLLKNQDGIKIIAPLQNVRNIDSTGAGDAFMSGFLYGLYHDYPVAQCIRFGNVAGGTCVQGMGCLEKYVTEEELLFLAERIEVDR